MFALTTLANILKQCYNSEVKHNESFEFHTYTHRCVITNNETRLHSVIRATASHLSIYLSLPFRKAELTSVNQPWAIWESHIIACDNSGAAEKKKIYARCSTPLKSSCPVH